MPKESTIIDPEIIDGLPDAPKQSDILITQVNDLYREFEYHGQKMWHVSVQMGAKLIELKRTIPRGQWGKLFEAKTQRVAFLEISLRHAQNCMTLYKQATTRTVKVLGEEEAEKFKVLCIEDKPTPELTEALNKISTAESLRQALFDFAQDNKPSQEGTHIRNFKGGKAGAEANARKKELAPIDNPVEALEPEVDEVAQRVLASDDIKHITELLDEFIEAGRHLAVIRDVRRSFARELRRYADLFEGITNNKLLTR